ncbi:hypothetical protein KEM54_004561, partial [Ascosphaera aggregata]
SQRDVSSQIPINYTPHVSVALTPACFGNGNYTNEAASLCVSNLLASGFRRFFIDVYWNQRTRQWQLCPVRAADHDDNNGDGKDKKDKAGPDADDSSASHKGYRNQTRRWYNTKKDITSPRKKTTRQVSSTRKQTFTVGEYTCSRSRSWETLIEVFADYLRVTEDTISAHLLFFVLNPSSADPVSESSERRLGKRSYYQHDDKEGVDTSPEIGHIPPPDSHPPHSKPKTLSDDGPS